MQATCRPPGLAWPTGPGWERGSWPYDRSTSYQNRFDHPCLISRTGHLGVQLPHPSSAVPAATRIGVEAAIKDLRGWGGDQRSGVYQLQQV